MRKHWSYINHEHKEPVVIIISIHCVILLSLLNFAQSPLNPTESRWIPGEALHRLYPIEQSPESHCSFFLGIFLNRRFYCQHSCSRSEPPLSVQTHPAVVLINVILTYICVCVLLCLLVAYHCLNVYHSASIVTVNRSLVVLQAWQGAVSLGHLCITNANMHVTVTTNKTVVNQYTRIVFTFEDRVSSYVKTEDDSAILWFDSRDSVTFPALN